MATKTADKPPTKTEPEKAPARRKRAPAPSNRSPQIESYLNDKGVKWEFIENVSPGSFDLQRSLRNQARLTKLISSQVETYLDAMKRGDQFPPVIAWRNDDNGKLVTIDGNHRLEVSRQLDRQLDAYVVYAEQQVITMMTFEANAKHGMPSSPAERVVHALWLIDTGASRADAAAAVGAKITDVNREWSRREAQRRADEVGFPRNQWDNLNPSARQRLLNLNTDEVFKAAAELSYKANLSADEVQEMVRQLNESRSVARQMAYIENLATGTYAERIASGAAIFGSKQRQNKSTPKTRASMAMGQVMHLPDNVASLVSYYTPEERETTALRAREAATKLVELATALESANEQA